MEIQVVPVIDTKKKRANFVIVNSSSRIIFSENSTFSTFKFDFELQMTLFSEQKTSKHVQVFESFHWRMNYRFSYDPLAQKSKAILNARPHYLKAVHYSLHHLCRVSLNVTVGCLQESKR